MSDQYYDDMAKTQESIKDYIKEGKVSVAKVKDYQKFLSSVYNKHGLKDINEGWSNFMFEGLYVIHKGCEIEIQSGGCGRRSISFIAEPGSNIKIKNIHGCYVYDIETGRCFNVSGWYDHYKYSLNEYRKFDRVGTFPNEYDKPKIPVPFPVECSRKIALHAKENPTFIEKLVKYFG